MAPHHRAADVAAGQEPARVSADPSRRLDEPEERTSPRSSHARAVTDATGGTPIAALHAALDSHPLERRPNAWRTWVSRRSRRLDRDQGRREREPGFEETLSGRERQKEGRTFRALVWKNARVKTRGAAAFCFVLELGVPVAFVLLMCLPRMLVSDHDVPAVFHRVAPLESLAWSRKPPSARAARLIFSPRTPAARAVAEAAGVTLVCGPDVREDTGRFAVAPQTDEEEDILNNPVFASFAQQVAAAAALDVDLAAVLAGTEGRSSVSERFEAVGPIRPSGGESLSLVLDPEITRTCLADPVACADLAASVVRLRADPPIALDSPLFAPPAELRASFCAASCVDEAACRRRVLDEFLVGVDTAEEAQALALGEVRRLEGDLASGPRWTPAMAVVSLPPDDVLRAPRARRVEYVIRVNASDTPTGASGPKWAQEKLVRWVVGEDDKWREYWTYVNVQRAFDQALLSLALSGRDEAFANGDVSASGDASASASLPLPRGVRLDVRVKAYPFPAYSTNLGSTYAAVFFGLAFVFAFVIAAASMCQSVVLEKELRLREGLELMGASRRAYWGSWFTTSYASLALVSFLVAAIGSYPFKHTDWTVTFAFLCVWSAQLVCFCFFLSACFRDAKVAAVAGALAYVLTWTPGVAAAAAAPDGSSAWLACTALMPASGVYMWGWAVAILENAQRGARWDTLFRNLLADDEASGAASGTFSAGGVLVVALANALAYGALAWAADAGALPFRALPARAAAASAWRLNPKRGGLTLNLNPTRRSETERLGTSAGAWDVAAIPNGIEPDLSADFSAEPHPHAAVRVANVSKTFNGTTRALDGVSFAARRGEITALLGHNGAGKTTLLSLVTGATSDFEGDAFVDGVDVKKHPRRARASLGVCPQHDVLWPSLTAREHLELFAALRAPDAEDAGSVPGGRERERDAARVAASLAAAGLARDADRLAGTLSGGQRRRLSLAIAFIGEPSVVLLDEPTAGMDPLARRHAWDVIRKMAGRRGGAPPAAEKTVRPSAPVSVLLTTHFMDEADALSDRVAVMHSGKLACAGSPLFIKASFGGGYVLRLRTRRDADFGAIESVVRRAGVETAPLSFADSTDARDVLKTRVATAVATVALPSSARASFPALLEALEGARGEAIGVLECGVGCASLEDAFLNVADRADGAPPGSGRSFARQTRISAAASASASQETETRLIEPESNDQRTRPRSRVAGNKRWVTFLAQTRATFWKRAVHCRRTFPSTVAGTLLAPLLFAVAGLAASSAAARRAGDPLPASMLDRSFLGDAPIGVASSSGRHAFVPGTAPAVPADPSDVVAFAGDALALLAEDGAVAPFPGVDRVWDCAADAPVLDACAHTCASCGPYETARRPTDTLETALAEKLAASFSRPQNLSSPSASSAPVFDAFASLDGVLLANAKPRATCAVGKRAGLATCASLFVEPGEMDTSRPVPRNGARRFRYTALTSSTAYHALPAAMATAHDAIFRALVSSSPESLRPIAFGEDDTSSPIAETRGDARRRRDDEPRLVSINHPLPGTRSEKQEKRLLSRLLVSLCVVVGLSAMSASAAAPFPARETASGAKHLQIVSGARRDAYWCGTFLWDACAQIPTAAALLVVLLAGGVAGSEHDENGETSSLENERVVALASALALFVCSATPLVYLVGAVAKFASAAAAVASTLALFVFFGVAQLLAGVTLGGLAGAGVAGGGAAAAWRACRVAFLWLPHYCVGRVVFDVAGGFGTKEAWAGDSGIATDGTDGVSTTLPSTTHEALLAMGVAFGVYASLVLLLEHAGAVDAAARRARRRVAARVAATLRFSKRRPNVRRLEKRLEKRNVPEGADPERGVTRETFEGHVDGSAPRFRDAPEDDSSDDFSSSAALVVRGLRKKYRGKPPASSLTAGTDDACLERRFAVDDVTFEVNAGESFALLGVNGAGKTTTFEMLTGALEPTRGDARVFSRRLEGRTSGLSLRRDADAFRRAVGYCPQRDALFESLSAREHLLFYGALRGLSNEESADAAARVAAAVGLEPATAVRPAREYSGGNKRALAVAIALMGDPACVLLDEPSTGMDPRARRRLWRALASASKAAGVAFVLTSHSMEEAEAVCGRVGLVEAGTLKHVGDVDAWRAALGTGHALEMRLRDASPARRDAVARFARETFRARRNGNRRAEADEEDVVALCDDSRAGLVKCRVPRAVPLSFVFQQVEAHRKVLGVEEYQVGAATLEETFLRFAGRGAS